MWRPFLLSQCFPFYNMVSEVRFQLAIDKIAAHLRGSCLSVILHWQLQRNHLNTQLKLAQKREPLFWQYTVCKWFKCNNKISLFDLFMCSQGGKGEVGMFVLSIHCMKKSPTSKNMILRKGKKIHERWIYMGVWTIEMRQANKLISRTSYSPRLISLLVVGGEKTSLGGEYVGGEIVPWWRVCLVAR